MRLINYVCTYGASMMIRSFINEAAEDEIIQYVFAYVCTSLSSVKGRRSNIGPLRHYIND